MTSEHRRIIRSGLVAGIVIVLSGVVMVPVLGEQMNTALAARGVPALGVIAMVYFPLHSVAIGLVLVWLYARLKPRVGDTPRTVVAVATLVWFLAYVSVNGAMVVYGFLPWVMSVVGTAWGFVEVLLGGAVGARMYERG